MEPFRHGDLTVAVTRQGQGPSVLFLHNGGTSSTIWRHQVRDLAVDHDVVAIDLPGFGASPRVARGLDLDDHLDLVGALVDQLGLAPVAIVGNCMGSNIAASFALRRPDAVRLLVLINPLTDATFAAGQLGPLRKLADRAPRVSSVVRRVSRRVVPPRLALGAVLRFQLGKAGVAAGLHRDAQLQACYRRSDQMPALIDVLDDMPARYGGLDALPEGALRPPVCTIWGRRNRVLSPRAGVELNRTLAPQRVESLRDCGHLPMLERPDDVTAIIREMLEETATTSVGAGATGEVGA